MSAVPEDFDYIIVGAGAAGCILANRLAADSARSVCLLEAGPRDKSLLLHVPAGVYKASSNPKYAWQFETTPSAGTANRAIPMPQGRTLGGSTAINGMNYNRGRAADYDGWAQRGNLGWAYNDILPYFKKSERWTGTADSYYRGTDGLLPVSDASWRHPVCDAFIKAAHDFGLPVDSDYNGASQTGVGYYQSYIENGWRVSAASAFLKPLANKRNLDIRTNAQATAILFEGKRAVGIRYARGPSHAPHVVKARREIILCAGAANTPKLLQISGIGPAGLLNGLDLPLIHDLPGVGSNLQDHYMVHLVVRVKGAAAIDGRPLALFSEAVKWLLGRPSILAMSPSLVYAFANSRDFKSAPDIQLDLALGNYSNEMLERFPVIKLGFYQMRPVSVGFVESRSPDPFSSPVIQPNYLSATEDEQVAIDSIRTLRRVLSAPGVLQEHCDTEELPGSSVVTDADCLEFARQEGLTAYHLCGTCKMGPRDDAMAVVDNTLRIHGLEGLRIADASIMPTVPSANTSAAVFMIAEKASDMILGREPLPALSPNHDGTVPSWRSPTSAPATVA
jgi:choline dehydrogenase